MPIFPRYFNHFALALLVVLLAACAAPVETPTQAPAEAPGGKSLPASPEPYPLDTPLPIPSPYPYPYPYPVSPTLNPEAPVSQPTYPEPLKPDALSPASNPYAPNPSDAALTTGSVGLQTVEVLTLESYPPQYLLHLAGTMSTPCHQLRVQIEPPNAENRVDVEVYSVVNPQMMCTQVLAEFDVNLPLTFPAPGDYTVWVNGQQASSVTVP